MAAEPEVEGEERAFKSLLDWLYTVADPRQERGIRYPLGGVPALCVLAFINGRTSLAGVSRFGRDNKGLLKYLGLLTST